MKIKKIKWCLIGVLLVASFNSFSQNEAYPYVLDIGLNDVDYSRLSAPFWSTKNKVSIKNTHHIFAPRIGFSALIANRIAINVSSTINSLVAIDEANTKKRILFLALDAEPEYILSNPLSKIVPSIYGGLGFTYIKKSVMISANAGGTLKFWVKRTLGIKLQAGIRQRISKYSGGYDIPHLFYSIGVTIPLKIFGNNSGRVKNSNWKNVDCN